MTPHAQSAQDRERSMSLFKKSIKEWLIENNFTQKELSLKLGVTYGTVRNWFASDSKISETNATRIRALMANPAAFRRNEVEPTYLTSLAIKPYKANMYMWRSAAQVKDVSFHMNEPMGTEAAAFAKWCTPLINQAIQNELKKHTLEEIKLKAKEVHITKDPMSEDYHDDLLGTDYQILIDEEARRKKAGIPIQLPILENKINSLFLDIAAECAGKDTADFIADALNAAAEVEFDAALTDYLEKEEEAVGEVAITKPSDDDVPF